MGEPWFHRRLNEFQHTAARRRLAERWSRRRQHRPISTHSRPKAAGRRADVFQAVRIISTHSRPKAAGWRGSAALPPISDFNTQPPEGGWDRTRQQHGQHDDFNIQPPEGGWFYQCRRLSRSQQFQHTAARRRLDPSVTTSPPCKSFQHTAARRRLGLNTPIETKQPRFQHTAARRRLGEKARALNNTLNFNTQPPEGGWAVFPACHPCYDYFNTQPPEGGWYRFRYKGFNQTYFNTQPPEGGWFAELPGEHLKK